MYSLSFQLAGVAAFVRDLETGVERELRRALLRVGDDTAAVARATHPYRNRTGRLEGSTEGYSVLYGSPWDGSLTGGVVAATPYASFVDAKPAFEFLGPAWRMYEPQADVVLEQALEAAGRER